MRKVSFSTLSTTVGEDRLNSNKNGLLNKKTKSKKEESNEGKTYRFDIDITTTTDDFCPEFSYKELIKDAQIQIDSSESKIEDLDEALEQAEDEKLKELARSFEAKYSCKKKKFKGAMEDYIDKGLGYDENDSFIDNEEAYDELIPSTITTKYGGFYINFGKLEFRACSDEEDNVLADGEDSKEIKFSSKKRKKDSRKKCMKITSDESENGENNDEIEESYDESSQSDNSNCRNKKKVKLNNPNQTIDSIIDSVIKQSNKNGSSNKNNSSLNQSNECLEENNQLDVKLSDDIPSRVTKILSTLKNMKLNQPDKKQRFFSDDVNKYVLEIDLLVQNCPSNIKNQVYLNLTIYLACGKDTLMKRIKKLRIAHEENRLKQAISTLRVEVSYLIEEYEEVYETQVNKWKQDKKNGLNVSDSPKLPEKEFKFNDKIRGLLKTILASKKILVDLAGIKGKLEEDNITNFFNYEIKNIWPVNWVSNSNLLKVAGFISKYNDPSIKPMVSIIKKNPTNITITNNSTSNLKDLNQALNLNTSKNSSTSANNSSSNTNTVNNSNNNNNKTKVPISKDSPVNSQIKVKQDQVDLKSTSNLSNFNIKSETNLSNKVQESSKKNQDNLVGTVPPLPVSKSNQNSNMIKNPIENNLNTKKQFSNEADIGFTLNKLAQSSKINLSKESRNSDKFNQQIQDISNQLKEQKQIKNLQQQQQQQSQSQQQIKHQSNKNVFEKVQSFPNFAPNVQHSVQTLKKQISSMSQVSKTNLNPYKLKSEIYQQKSHSDNISRMDMLGQDFSKKSMKNKTPIVNKPLGQNSKLFMNKSLECDYKFDTAIKKSLIDEANKQVPTSSNNNLPMTHFQRSSSVGSIMQTPPTIKNQQKLSSTPNNSSNNQIFLNLPQNQQQLFQHLTAANMSFAMQQLYLTKYSEICKNLQLSNTKSNDLKKEGNNTNIICELNSNTNTNVNNNFNLVKNLNQQNNFNHQNSNLNLANTNNTPHISQPVSSPSLTASFSNNLNNQHTNVGKAKNDFNINTLINNNEGKNLNGTFTSKATTNSFPKQVSQSSSNNLNCNVQKNRDFEKKFDINSIYSDYLNSKLHQQKLHQHQQQQHQYQRDSQ